MSETQSTTETPRSMRRIVKMLSDDGFDVVHVDDGSGHTSSGCKGLCLTRAVCLEKASPASKRGREVTP